MSLLKTHGVIEEIQDYIAANSGLGYTTGTNFVIGDVLDMATLGATEAIDLSMYVEGAQLIPSGKRWYMHRNIRFVFKSTFGQGAVNKAWEFVDWVVNERSFYTTTYRVWYEVLSKPPSVIGATRADAYLADTVVQFLLLNKTG